MKINQKQYHQKPSSNYNLLTIVGAGTYGTVYKGYDQYRKTFVAMKKLNQMGYSGGANHNNGFSMTSIREIKLLQSFNHKNIIKLIDILVTKNSDLTKPDNVWLIFEYMEHDLQGLIASGNLLNKWGQSDIKCITKQIITGVCYLHSVGVVHRDIKSANILVNNNGEVKVADFGLARQLSQRKDILYTNKVVTLWYRAPELLLGLNLNFFFFLFSFKKAQKITRKLSICDQLDAFLQNY